MSAVLGEAGDCALSALCVNSIVPEISRFLGIIIAMYYRDHTPPHFHAKYGEYEVTIEIASENVNGEFPPPAPFRLPWNGLGAQR